MGPTEEKQPPVYGEQNRRINLLLQQEREEYLQELASGEHLAFVDRECLPQEETDQASLFGENFRQELEIQQQLLAKAGLSEEHTPGVGKCFTDFLSRGAQKVYEIPKFPIERKEKALRILLAVEKDLAPNADENMQRLLMGAWDNAAVPSAKQIERAQETFKKEYIRDHGWTKWETDFEKNFDEKGIVFKSFEISWRREIFAIDGKTWIPPTRHDLLIRIIALAHGGDAGHRSRKHTAEAVANRFVCTDMDIAKLAKEFVENCLICNCCDVRKIIPRSFGQHMVATEPNEILSWDYLSMGPTGNGDFNYVLVLKDHFSGYVSLAPCQTQDARTSALHIVEWVMNFGFPKVQDGTLINIS